MASQPTPQPQGAQPGGAAGAAPGGAPAGGAQPGQASGPQPLQIIAAITRLAQMLAQASSSTAPDAEEIIKNVQSAARKLMPQQAEQRQQSPF